jgi:hypothetical protein
MLKELARWDINPIYTSNWNPFVKIANIVSSIKTTLSS